MFHSYAPGRPLQKGRQAETRRPVLPSEVLHLYASRRYLRLLPVATSVCFPSLRGALEPDGLYVIRLAGDRYRGRDIAGGVRRRRYLRVRAVQRALNEDVPTLGRRDPVPGFAHGELRAVDEDVAVVVDHQEVDQRRR
jgi:hypothetical protein